MDRENMRCLSNDDIIRLLKQGRAPEIEKIADEQKRRNYPNRFPVFMDMMIDEYKVKKRQIALRSGLSQDYVYKLLRGDKHTDERDYIIAICMAIGMNISQTRHALECYGMRTLNIPEARKKEEACSILVQRATMLRRSGDIEASFELLKQALDMMIADEAQRDEYCESIACTYVKLGIIMEDMGRPKDALEYWQALYDMKDSIPDGLEEDSVVNVRNCIAEAIKHFFYCAQASGDKAAEIGWLKQSIDMTDGFCRDEQEWIGLFRACIGYADRIDDIDPSAAEFYYQKAVDIARDRGLLSVGECRRSIPVLYNNYASLLWNKFGSEEAIVYYSMAIDTTLSYFRTGEIPESEMKKGIGYFAGHLKNIYTKTGKTKESERLEKRLKDLGIDI